MKLFFNNIISPDNNGQSSTDKQYDGKTQKTALNETTFFTLNSTRQPASNPNTPRPNIHSTTSKSTIASSSSTLQVDQNASMDWKLCFNNYEDYVEFTIFMNSLPVIQITRDFRLIGCIMISLVGIRLLSLSALILSSDQDDWNNTIVAFASVLLVISVAHIVMMIGLYIWNRVSRVSQMMIDETIFITSIFLINAFALISSQIQVEFTSLNELDHYSAKVNSYYSKIKAGEEMTLTHELLLYCMLVPVIAHASCATVRWIFVLLSIPFVLAIAITTVVTVDALQSLSIVIALCILDIYLLVAQRIERIRLFNSSRKIQEVATTSKEVTIHLQSQEKDAVNLRHIVANTAHDLKTPVVAMVHGCEILHGNVTEINKACKSINQKIQPIDAEIKDHITRRTEYIEEEMRAALDTLEDIKNTSNFMLLTINRFLDYTKVAHGFKLAPKLDTFNLLEALNLSIHCIGKTAIHGKVEVCQIPPNICKFVVTDKQWFQENIICLVSNALKFSPSGGIKIRISMKFPPPKLVSSPQNSMRELEGNKRSAQSVRILNKMSEISMRWGASKDKKPETSTTFAPKEFDYEGYKILVEVSDCGVGISKDMQRQLFEPFRQAQRLAGGTGLGLFSLSKRLDALQGEYGVKEREDGKQGSLFWFAFPYRPDEMFAQAIETSSDKGASGKTSVHEYITRRSEKINKMISEKLDSASETEMEESSSRALKTMGMLVPPPIIISNLSTADYGEEASTTNPSPLFSPRATAKQKMKKNLRILIVDDSPTILKMTSKLLLRFGYDVSTAENGYDAIQLLERESFQFDVVLTDLEMPVLDGLEMMKRIRQMEERRLGAEPLDKQKVYNVFTESSSRDEDNSETGLRPFNTKPLFIIAASANNSPATVEDSLGAGANEFLGKPITSGGFQNILKSHNLLTKT